MKSVASLLEVASLGRVEATILKRSPECGRNNEPVVKELKEYEGIRDKERVLVAKVPIDVKDCLDIPCLTVSSSDMNMKNFGPGLGEILLEPKGCIFFETKLSKKGVERLANILKKCVDLWDSRLMILLENNPSFPGALSGFVEKTFEAKVDKTASSPRKRRKTAENESECVKGAEICELNKELCEYKEHVDRLSVKIKDLENKIILQHDIIMKRDEDLLIANEELEKAKHIEEENTEILKSKLECLSRENESIATLHSSALSEKEHLAEQLESEQLRNFNLEEKISQVSVQNETLNLKLKGLLKDNQCLQDKMLEEHSIGKVAENIKDPNAENYKDSAGKIVKDLVAENPKQPVAENVKEPVANESSKCGGFTPEKLRERALKISTNLKLSPKVVVFRIFSGRGGSKHFKVEEHVNRVDDDTMSCDIEVKVDTSGILMDHVFKEFASSKTKAVDKAYTSIIDYIKS